MSDYRVVLSEEDFRKLVAGGIVTKRGIGTELHVLLSDIGWDRMTRAIEDARAD